jgi:TetR/AcrR family transcriptional regulator
VTRTRHPDRANEILHTLAVMLEDIDAGPVRTAALAREVGVSEAALYKHFPSKGRMFRALIEFIEESLFSHTKRILSEQQDAELRCGKILNLYLGFAEQNPGLCRILTGDALASEDAELKRRARRISTSLETQLKQVFREAMFHGRRPLSAQDSARLLMTMATGRISQYVASQFQVKPSQDWATHWEFVATPLFGNLDRSQLDTQPQVEHRA